MSGRPGFFAAGAELVLGAVALALGFENTARSLALGGALILIVACVVQVIQNSNERKTNGRHRKAPEAHRAGAGGGSGDGTRAGGGASGRAGAGMSRRSGNVPGGLNPNFHARVAEEAARQAARLAAMQVPAQPVNVSRPAGEFDGNTVEFAAGVVTGTRSFDVDKLGRLVGVTFASVWTPGENDAKCMDRIEMGSVSYGPIGSFPTFGTRAVESSRKPHPLVSCGHGLYGYYEGSNDYYAAGRVMGVIEAYGETVIGTRGFRASKARIVALHLPPEMSKPARALVARNYSGIPTFDSFDAMVAEFPPDDGGHGINPSTDPDFWTRRA